MNKSINDIVTQTVNSLPVEITDGELVLFNSFPLHEVVPALKKLVKGESTNLAVASRAFDALMKLESFDQVNFLIEFFDESNVDWKLVCCQTFIKFPDKRVINKLCEIVLNEPEPDLRCSAVESLSVIGDKSVLDTLEKVKLEDKGMDFEGFRISDMAQEVIQKIRFRTSEDI